MALTLIKEDGSSKVDANSYADVADGDAYHEGHLYASPWSGASADDKAKALVMATRVIDAEYEFGGAKTSANQALQWPRYKCPDRDGAAGSVASAYLVSNKVPAALVNATCEMARELLVADRTASVPGEGLDTVTTGAGATLVSTKYSKNDVRPTISRLTQAMLVKYGDLLEANTGTVRLIRA